MGVANVLKMWGPSRLTKRKDETAADHYFRFNQGFPECLKPVTPAEKDAYIDLMNRSMYLISLDDDYLQKEVSNLKTANPTIKMYFDEVVSAEGRLNTYNDITKSSTSTEGSGIAVSYVNSKTGNKAKNGNKTSAKQKEFVPKKNAKGENLEQNQNRNQNSDKQKSKTNPKQNKSKKKLFCHYHKENMSHTSKDCYVLKRNKNINKVEDGESEEDHYDNNNSNEGLFVFNSITAVTLSIKSFASMNDSHPMVTIDPLLTKLNVENFAH